MDAVTEAIKKLALRYPCIYRVILFGSRARGDYTEQSDYDVAVFGADRNTEILFTDDIEGIPSLHKIDLIFIRERHRKLSVYENIRKDGVILMDRFLCKFGNYRKALERLKEGLRETETNDSETLRDGVIQRFEFTTELAWKTVREFLISEGEADINSPKPVMRAAYRTGLIADENGWIELLNDRNSTAHIYDEGQAEEVFERIRSGHVALFERLLNVLDMRKQEDDLAGAEPENQTKGH